MPDWVFHALTLVLTAVGLWFAYRGVSAQVKASQDVAASQRDRQHIENRDLLFGMRQDIAIIKTELRPLVRWWNGGPANGDDR